MLPQRSILGASQPFALRTRTPAFRSGLQQRFATTEAPPLTGAADNAFNRERRAVKAHAAATSGKLFFIESAAVDGSNRISRYMAETLNLVSQKQVPYYRKARLTDCSVVIPCLIMAGANAWVLWNEHWEHQAHLPPLDQRPQYAYLNIRTKKYPWGDGDKVSFSLRE